MTIARSIIRSVGVCTAQARIGIASSKLVSTIDQHAYTAAASVPLALNHLFESGKLRRDQLLLLAAMGGGFTWGSILMRW